MNGQMDIFSIGKEPLKIKNKIRLIEVFGGIGSQAKALERIGADFEHYRLCEFDPYAVTSYNAIHGTNFTPSDVTELKGADLGIEDVDRFTYVLTYSYPCQSLSIAGKQEGMVEGSGTQSSLLWEVKRLLEETAELPQILVMENVPQVLSDKNKDEFYRWVNFLESKGYTNKWEILNSKDYGVPQNRDRCFMVSWLGDYYYPFPQPKPLEKVLRDLLQPDSEIDEKYYLSEKKVIYLTSNSEKQKLLGNGFNFNPTTGDGIAKCILTRPGERMDDNFIKCVHIAQLDGVHEMANRVYSPNGLRTMQGGNLEPKIMTEPVLVGGYGEKKSNGGTQWYQQDRVYSADSVAMAHCASIPQGSYSYYTGNKKSPIRKLTQKECWRLMNFDDCDYENARKALNDTYYKGKDKSGSQLYKQAGNSIVVAVLEAIFNEML